MTFVQRRNHLTTHFSEHIPVVKRRISVYDPVQYMLYLDLYIVQFAYKQDSLHDEHQYSRPNGTNHAI